MEQLRKQANFLRGLVFFAALAILTIGANRCAFGQQQDDKPKKSTSTKREPSAESNTIQAIMDARTSDEFAEKYGYEVTGASFMNEIAGEPVDISSRSFTNFSLLNSILSGDHWKDLLNGTDFSIGGQPANPTIAAALNSVGEGHSGVRNTMQEQMNDLLNMTGHGQTVSGTPVTPGPVVDWTDWSLVGDIGSDYVAIAEGGGATDGVTAPASDTGGGSSTTTTLPSDAPTVSTPPVLTPSDPGNTPMMTVFTTTGGGTDAGTNLGTSGGIRKLFDIVTDHAKPTETFLDCKMKHRADCGSAPSTPTTRMTDPDAGSGAGSPIVLPTLQQIQTIFMKNKRPVNPDDNLGSPSIPSMNTTGLPVQSSDIDPTIALYDGSQDTGGITVSADKIFNLHSVGGGVTDTRPELAPVPPTPK